MDGEHRECPIVPNNVIRVRFGENDEDCLLIAPSHDSIQIFPDSKYNHLRYYDSDEQALRAVWLASHVLADLHDMGIPHTSRESVTESEHEAYMQYLSQIAIETTGVEVDPVEEAMANLDEEWKYLQGEEGWNGAI